MANRGTGAGGANTTKNGIAFENVTSSIVSLIKLGFQEKKGYYELIKENRKIVFVTQNQLKKYLNEVYNIKINRKPDEAFIIEKDGDATLYIIEKKNQNVNGSVFDKLYGGKAICREYQIWVGSKIKVEYLFVLSDYLKNLYLSDRYSPLRTIHQEDGIQVLFGSDNDYFDKLVKLLNF